MTTLDLMKAQAEKIRNSQNAKMEVIKNVMIAKGFSSAYTNISMLETVLGGIGVSKEFGFDYWLSTKPNLGYKITDIVKELSK